MTILNVITPSRLSGAERVLGWLSVWEAQHGHRVIVAMKDNPVVADWYRSLGLDVRVLPISGKLNVRAATAVFDLIKSERVDAVHTHLSSASLWGCLAARRAKIPCVAHVHAMNSSIFFRYADRLIAVSEAARQNQIRQGVSPERIHMVWPVTPALGEPPPEPAKDVLAMGSKVVAIAAHLSKKKGHRVLLMSAPIVLRREPRAVFVLAGEGPESARLSALAQRLGISERVKFLGYRRDAASVLGAARAAVLPSLSMEGFPIMVQEAQHSGRPVVVSRVGGMSEFVQDGVNGFVVEPGDVEGLAEKLTILLTNDVVWERQSEAARRAVEGLNFDESCSRVVDLLGMQS